MSSRSISPRMIRSCISVCILGVASIMWNCQYPQSPENGNTSPQTGISNVPPNDTIAQYIELGKLPEFVLYWVGNDPDGYVVAFKYRWTDIAQGVSQTTPHTTLMNVFNLGGASLRNAIIVKQNASPLNTMYKFFTTLSPTDPVDTSIVNRVGDSLATGRTFAVPYKTGIVPGDSVYGAPPKLHRAPTTGKFIFDSPANSNLHRFEVAAIDNDGVEDPSPAVVNFWTRPSPIPLCRITGVPLATDTVVIHYPNDIFRGLLFTFGFNDSSTFIQQWSWSVDDTVSWTPYSDDNFARVTASMFKPDSSGLHRIYVRVRNKWGVASPIVSASFRAFVPALDKPNFVPRILVVNSDVNGNGSVGFPDSNQVKQFYQGVMDSLGKSGKYELLTLISAPLNYFLTLEQICKYSVVIYLVEQRIPTTPGPNRGLSFTDARRIVLKQYLSIGGKFIFSGPQDLNSAIPGFYNDWGPNFLHVRPFSLGSVPQNNDRDFIGAKGTLGYPDIMVDPAKLPADSTGAIRSIALNYPQGFAQSISIFDSKSDKANFENQPLGIRFLAGPPVPPARTTYSLVHFGFPLYYCQTSSVIQALRKALSDINE